MAHSYWSLFFVFTQVYIENVALYTRRNAFFSGDILTLMASKPCKVVWFHRLGTIQITLREAALVTNHNIVLTLVFIRTRVLKHCDKVL